MFNILKSTIIDNAFFGKVTLGSDHFREPLRPFFTNRHFPPTNTLVEIEIYCESTKEPDQDHLLFLKSIEQNYMDIQIVVALNTEASTTNWKIPFNAKLDILTIEIVAITLFNCTDKNPYWECLFKLSNCAHCSLAAIFNGFELTQLDVNAG